MDRQRAKLGRSSGSDDLQADVSGMSSSKLSSSSGRSAGRYAMGASPFDSKAKELPSMRKAGSNTGGANRGLRASMPSMSAVLGQMKAQDAAKVTDSPVKASRQPTPELPSVQDMPEAEASAQDAAALQQAQSSLAAAQAELQAVQAEKASLQEQLSTCQQQIKFMQSSNDATSSTSQIYQLMFRQELMGSMSRVEELKTLVAEQQTQLQAETALRVEVEGRLQRAVEEGERQAARQQDMVDAAREKEVALEATIPRYKNAAIEAELRADHLKVDLHKLKTELSSLQPDLDEARGAAAAAEEEARAYASQLETLQAQHDLVVKELDDYKVTMRHRLATQQADTQQQLRTAAEAASQQHSQQLQQLRAAAEAASQQLQQSEAARLQLASERDAQARALKDAQAEVVGLKRLSVEVVELRGLAVELRGAREKAETEAGLLLERSELLQGQLKDSHAARSKLQQQVVELQESQADRVLAVERLTSRLQEQQQRTLQLSSSHATLQDQLQEARRDAEDMSNMLGEKMAEVADLTVEKERLAEQLAVVAAKSAAVTAAAEQPHPPPGLTLPSPGSTSLPLSALTSPHVTGLPAPSPRPSPRPSLSPRPATPSDPVSLLARREVQLEALRCSVAKLEERLAEESAHNRLLKEQVKVNGNLRERVSSLESAQKAATAAAATQAQQAPGAAAAQAGAAAVEAGAGPQPQARRRRGGRALRVVGFVGQLVLSVGVGVGSAYGYRRYQTQVVARRVDGGAGGGKANEDQAAQ